MLDGAAALVEDPPPSNLPLTQSCILNTFMIYNAIECFKLSLQFQPSSNCLGCVVVQRISRKTMN